MKPDYPSNAVALRIQRTRVGDLSLLASKNGVAGLYFPGRLKRNDWQPTSEDPAAEAVLDAACSQLDEYFAGKREAFDLVLDAVGTDFQRSVWGALSAIPFGETRSYQDIANAIGNPKAVRAVGLANGSNPISIIVPCHRVIGADGSLTGFGGGLETKRQLLEHEGALLPL